MNTLFAPMNRRQFTLSLLAAGAGSLLGSRLLAQNGGRLVLSGASVANDSALAELAASRPRAHR